MEFLSFGTPINNIGSGPSSNRLTTHMKLQEEYAREILTGELSVANILASLLAKVRYDNANGKATQLENWKFLDSSFSEYFGAIIEKYTEEGVCSMIDRLLTIEMPVGECQPPMKVVASNDVKDILERTRGWKMDFKALEEFADSATDTIIATEVRMKYPTWGELDLNTSFCCGCEILELPNIEGGNSFIERDALGFVTGSYLLPYGDGCAVQVRITHCPRNCVTPFTMEQLLLSHATEPLTPLTSSDAPGFKFPVVNVPLTTAGIRSLMGATNDDSQIVAIQSDGLVQISKASPLNWECRSIVVDRDRCMCESREQYMQFYEKVGRRAWWNNMIEILVDGHLVTAVMVNYLKHMDRN